MYMLAYPVCVWNASVHRWVSQRRAAPVPQVSELKIIVRVRGYRDSRGQTLQKVAPPPLFTLTIHSLSVLLCDVPLSPSLPTAPCYTP